jgi:hypothetical protein
MSHRSTLVVDVANVMGSRPDGWWRDRSGAASRLLSQLGPLVGREIAGPDGDPLAVRAVLAVVEGAARSATSPDTPGLTVIRAAADGDSTIAEQAQSLCGRTDHVLVITADRGLRGRLPPGCAVAGPRWLLNLLESGGRDD